ncbi:alanine racemase [Brevibacillus dissolubilis]|uniref:alanine racemase n=1 Tax=Brevibacillus dissolubilis TaxID=1844116 RepID=UPI0011171B38|nr:alanine racemase [Brevibacillus dissolubilis]
MKPYVRESWVEIDLDAIAANVQAIKRHIPDTARVMAVVKANAYGHGSVQVAREALESGADCLAVATLEEAEVLRKAGITAAILILGFTPVSAVRVAVELDIELTAWDVAWLEEAEQLLAGQDVSQPLGIHVKVDTGMGRLGVCEADDLLLVAGKLNASSVLRWSGIFTHFACADEPDTEHVQAQHKRFQQLLDHLRQNGFTLPQVHACNTAAAIAFPEWSYDLVRFGIGLYGLYPSAYIQAQGLINLTPALSLKTTIANVKRIDQPSTISYGATYTAQPGEWIATLPIGYADGYSRMLSNRGAALYNGVRVPVVGKVCMDQIMVRIEDGHPQRGDEVVLYGKQGDQEISVDEVADLLGTINYEVTCMLKTRLPYVYLKKGQCVEGCHLLTNKSWE